jgi:hypothetical protein
LHSARFDCEDLRNSLALVSPLVVASDVVDHLFRCIEAAALTVLDEIERHQWWDRQ